MPKQSYLSRGSLLTKFSVSLGLCSALLLVSHCKKSLTPNNSLEVLSLKLTTLENTAALSSGGNLNLENTKAFILFTPPSDTPLLKNANNPLKAPAPNSAPPLENPRGSSSLKQLLNNGTLQEIIFSDNNGNRVKMEISDLKKLGENYLGVVFKKETDLNATTAIINLNTNQILALTDYALETLQIHNNFLYALKDSTLYRFNLQEGEFREATPLNNKDLLPIDQDYDFGLAGNEAYIGSFAKFAYLIGNEERLLVYSQKTPYILFPGSSLKPFKISDRPDLNINPNPAYYGGWNAGYLYGEDGYIYSLRITAYPASENVYPDGAARLNLTEQGLEIYMDQNATIGAPTNIIPGAYRNCETLKTRYYLADQQRYIILNEGFYKVSTTTEGNVQLKYFPYEDLYRVYAEKIQIPGLKQYRYECVDKKAILSGDYLYWQEDNKILRLNLAAETLTPKTILTCPTGFTRFTAAAEYLFFTKRNGLELETYFIKEENLEPTLLTTNSELQLEHVVFWP